MLWFSGSPINNTGLLKSIGNSSIAFISRPAAVPSRSIEFNIISPNFNFFIDFKNSLRVKDFTFPEFVYVKNFDL